MPTCPINGVTIHYEQGGEEHKADALVLLHGFPMDSRMWREQLGALSGARRIVAPDFRGFGKSSETGPFTIEQLADDTMALVERLKLGRIVLGGLSMGGYVALAFARKYPSALRGLMLLDTKAEADGAEARENRDRMIAIAREKGARPIAEAMLGKLIPEESAKRRPQLVRELRLMMEEQRPHTIANALAAMRDRPDQTASLASIAAPTLIVVGEKDAITPPEVARGMNERIPRSTLKVVSGAGHMSPMEQPEQVNTAVEQFLGGI
jgi:pimeloyl-ACP methyl ester carboxylesterase